MPRRHRRRLRSRRRRLRGDEPAMRVSRRLLVGFVPIDGFRGRRCTYHRRPGRRFASRHPVRRHRRRLLFLLDFNLFILNLLDLNLLRLEVLVVRVPRSVVLVARVHVYRAASRGGYLGSRGKLLHRHDWRQRWRRRRGEWRRRFFLLRNGETFRTNRTVSHFALARFARRRGTNGRFRRRFRWTEVFVDVNCARRRSNAEAVVEEQHRVHYSRRIGGVEGRRRTIPRSTV